MVGRLLSSLITRPKSPSRDPMQIAAAKQRLRAMGPIRSNIIAPTSAPVFSGAVSGTRFTQGSGPIRPCPTYVAQFNPDTNHPELNAARMIQLMVDQKLKHPSTKLFLFPECSTCGHNARDGYEDPGFLKEIEIADNQIIQAANALGVAVLFGTVTLNKEREQKDSGKLARNTMKFAVPNDKGLDIVFNHGKPHKNIYQQDVYNPHPTKRQRETVTVYEQYKIHLPTYYNLEQNERCYFEPGKIEDMLRIDMFGKPTALHLCEDGWDGKVVGSDYLYPDDTYRQAIDEVGARLIINLSASPFYVRKVPFNVRNTFGGNVQHYTRVTGEKVTYLWASIAGWESPLCYAGMTGLYVPTDSDGPGDPAFIMKPLEQDGILVDINYEPGNDSTLEVDGDPSPELAEAKARATDLLTERLSKEKKTRHDARMVELETGITGFLKDYGKKCGMLARDDLDYDSRVEMFCSAGKSFDKALWRARRNIRESRPRGIVFQLRSAKPIDSIDENVVGAIVAARLLRQTFSDEDIVMFCDRPVSAEIAAIFDQFNVTIKAPSSPEKGLSISMYEWAKKQKKYWAVSIDDLSRILMGESTVYADVTMFSSLSKTNLADLVAYWKEHDPTFLTGLDISFDRAEMRRQDKVRKAFQAYGREYGTIIPTVYNQFVRIKDPISGELVPVQFADRIRWAMISQSTDPRFATEKAEAQANLQQIAQSEEEFLRTFKIMAVEFNASMSETSDANYGVMLGRREPFRTRHIKERSVNIPRAIERDFTALVREQIQILVTQTPGTPECIRQERLQGIRKLFESVYESFTGMSLLKRRFRVSPHDHLTSEYQMITLMIRMADSKPRMFQKWVTTPPKSKADIEKLMDDLYRFQPGDLRSSYRPEEPRHQEIALAFRQMFIMPETPVKYLRKGDDPFSPTGGSFVGLGSAVDAGAKAPVRTTVVQMDFQSGNPDLNVSLMIAKLRKLKEAGNTDLAVFPEMAIPGAQTRDDMALSDHVNARFVRECDLAWEKLRTEAEKLGIAIIVGTIRKNDARNTYMGGKPLAKCVRMFVPASVRGITTVEGKRFREYCQDQVKIRNSRTDFDYQYYEEGSIKDVIPLNIGGNRTMIGIGEDAFSFAGDYTDQYHDVPHAFYSHAKDLGVTQIINPSCYPYTAGSFVDTVLPSLLKAANQYQMRVVHVCPSGWQENKMYGGYSSVIGQTELAGPFIPIQILGVGSEETASVIDSRDRDWEVAGQLTEAQAQAIDRVADQMEEADPLFGRNVTTEKIAILRAAISGMAKKMGITDWPELEGIPVADDKTQTYLRFNGFKGVVLDMPPAIFTSTTEINSSNVGVFVLAKLLTDAGINVQMLHSRGISGRAERYLKSIGVRLVPKTHEPLTYAKLHHLFCMDHTDLTDITEGAGATGLTDTAVIGMPIPAHNHLLASFTKSEIWEIAHQLFEKSADDDKSYPALMYYSLEQSRRRYHDAIYARIYEHKRNFLATAQTVFPERFGRDFDPERLKARWTFWPSKERRFFGTLERCAARVDATKCWGAFPTLGHTLLTRHHPARQADPSPTDWFLRIRALVRHRLTQPMHSEFKKIALPTPFGPKGTRHSPSPVTIRVSNTSTPRTSATASAGKSTGSSSGNSPFLRPRGGHLVTVN